MFQVSMFFRMFQAMIFVCMFQIRMLFFSMLGNQCYSTDDEHDYWERKCTAGENLSNKKCAAGENVSNKNAPQAKFLAFAFIKRVVSYYIYIYIYSVRKNDCFEKQSRIFS